MIPAKWPSGMSIGEIAMLLVSAAEFAPSTGRESIDAAVSCKGCSGKSPPLPPAGWRNH
jgi:hypothetical protein